MSRLTRDGTAEPVSRDQILRHARGQGDIIFPAQLTTSRIGNFTRLIHTLLYVMTIHTYYIRTYICVTTAVSVHIMYYKCSSTYMYIYGHTTIPGMYYGISHCLKKNLNAPRPSEHPVHTCIYMDILFQILISKKLKSVVPHYIGVYYYFSYWQYFFRVIFLINFFYF